MNPQSSQSGVSVLFCDNVILAKEIKLSEINCQEAKKCELTYPKPNFLECGGPKSNHGAPMHRGIMQKRESNIKNDNW